MKVNSISSTNFQTGIRISAKENENCKYLYNHVNNLTKEFHIPATFHTKEIELPSVSKAILSRLQELGIKFSNK